MDYDAFKNVPNVDDIERVFKTARGSTYAHYGDATTQRNRSSLNHRDVTEGMQPRSGKTVFMDNKSVNTLAGYFQNPDMATAFQPVMDQNGKPTGRAALTLTEDYGPLKSGKVLTEVPYQTKPSINSLPVEIYRSSSGMGDPGKGIHFGNPITEIHEIPKGSALKALGKLGAGATLAGAAKSAMAGEYGKAVDQATDLLTLPFAESKEVSPGTLPADVVARERAIADMTPQQRDVYYQSVNAKANGGVVMPNTYSHGRWRLI